METLIVLLPEITAYISALAGLIVAAKAVTILTPTQVDDRILGGAGKVVNLVLRVLNTLALNIGKDVNADDPKARS